MTEIRRKLLTLALLVGVSVLAYLPVILEGGFIWDDDDYVTENPVLVEEGGLGRMWFDRTSLPQYYPLVHTSFWLEYRLWGFDPRGYHVVNVLLHALSAWLLWLILRRLEVPGALLGAALFAVHPVHVESVAWITERKNVLSAVFYLLALAAWLRLRPAERTDLKWGRSGWLRYVGVLLLFTAALLSKTVTCTLPAVLLVIAWWKRGRLVPSDAVTLPLFALGIAFGIGTAQFEAEHVQAVTGLAPAERLALAGRVPWFYAFKLLWPQPLVFIYPKWDPGVSSAGAWIGLLGLIALVGLLWVRRARWGRGPLAAVLLFVGTLFPALGFIDVFPFRYSWVADHFQYLASVPLLALAAAGIVKLVGGGRGELVAVALAVAALGPVTWIQGGMYRDVESLWTETVAANPDAWMAQNNLGGILMKRSREARERGDDASAARFAADARRHIEAAVRGAPDAYDVRINHGVILLDIGDLDGAEREFKLADAACEKEFGTRSTIALTGLGDVWLLRKVWPKAGYHYQTALAASGSNHEARLKLAGVLMTVGRLEEAEHELGVLLKLAPGHAGAQDLLRTVRARAEK